jgi:hypothetical protein
MLDTGNQKLTERSDSTLRHSIFDNLRFCGSLFDFSVSLARYLDEFLPFALSRVPIAESL